MRLRVQVEPTADVPPDVDYRWDADTDILSVRVRSGAALPLNIALAVAGAEAAGHEVTEPSLAAGDGLSGAVELEGRDGSWIVLDVEAGHLAGVEVAVWPNVRRIASLLPPAVVEDARVRVAGRRSGAPRGSSAGSVEVATHLTAEADAAERTIHFRLGPPRAARAVRLGRDLLVDVDSTDHLAGLWLLNVPPVPTVT